MADPNQAQKQGAWKCPCNGCKRARKVALKQVQEILDSSDVIYSWWLAQQYIKEELEKK